MQDAGGELRDYVRQLLEIAQPDDDRWRRRGPTTGRPAARRRREVSGRTRTAGDDDMAVEQLRERGAELLRQSADVHHAGGHAPRVLARAREPRAGRGRAILRLLAVEGPQPSIDIRTSPPLGIGSEMVASGMNMIGPAAGCRDPDRVHSYLGNLYRLGLIWFSREELDDQGAYHVLEAQPEVQVAMSEAGRTRTVRRSIHLTAFGSEFCSTCLPLDSRDRRATGQRAASASPAALPARAADPPAPGCRTSRSPNAGVVNRTFTGAAGTPGPKKNPAAARWSVTAPSPRRECLRDAGPRRLWGVPHLNPGGSCVWC